MKEKKARVEDALHACRAAVEEGILPGGGVAVLRARKALDALKKKATGDERVGIDIVSRAVSAPIKQIAANCGLDGSVIAAKVEESNETNFGYNALTHEFGDLVKMGVIVPTKVERIALQNAASIAGLLLTTDSVAAAVAAASSKASSVADAPRAVEPAVAPACAWTFRSRSRRSRPVSSARSRSPATCSATPAEARAPRPVRSPRPARPAVVTAR
jgi:chaperonin GroEL (HSP60 family)